MTHMNNVTLIIGNNPMDTLLIGICIRHISALAFPPEECSAIELAVVEAVNNAIEHAYGEAEEGKITVSYSLSEDGAVIEIIDRGRGMASHLLADKGNPLEFDPEDIDNLPERGMGIWLIRSCMDSAAYHSGGDCNRWTLTKYRKAAEAA
ncbi:ATP-binding protein [Methylomagnum sp.]